MKIQYRKAKALDALANMTKRIKIRSISYLSWWIANLGVVPLILFADLRLAPAFLALFSLFTLVTHVFETILSLLYRAYFFKSYNSLKYLRIKASNVKALLCFALICPQICYSSTQNHEIKQNIVIEVGEHREISCPTMERYTLTNKKPLSHRDVKKKGHILLRGIKPGHSQLITWDRGGIKRTYSISVIAKNNVNNNLTLIKVIKELGVDARPMGNQILVYGLISDLLTFKALQLLNKKYKDTFLFNLNYSPILSNKIREVVYGPFLKRGIHSVRCIMGGITPRCYYDKSSIDAKTIINSLSSTFSVQFIGERNLSESDNYILKLKLVQFERTDGMELNFGLSQLSGGIKAVFNNGPLSLIEANQVLLREHKINISTLAEPTVRMRPNHKATIEVGGEYPYQSINTITGRQNTSWRFAGLKVDLNLSFENEKAVMSYSTNFTTPGTESSIIGNRESGNLKLVLGNPVELFKVMLKTNSGMKGQIPLLGSIPFLGHLFSSSNSTENYKQIVAVMELHRDE